MEKENKVAAPVVSPTATAATAATATAAPIQPAAPAFRIEASRQRRRYLNGLFYGDYGVGKTTLVATASEVPSMRAVLYVNAEGGDASIESFDLDTVTVSNYAQFARVHDFLRVHCKLRDIYLAAEDYKGASAATREEARLKLLKHEAHFRGVDPAALSKAEPTLYHTVIIDTLTEVQKYCMYQLLGIRVGEFALDSVPDAPELSEWNRAAEMIRILIRSYRDLSINALFVCARDESQDQQKRYHYAPMLPGKLGREVRGFFDVVGYMVAALTEGGEVHRRLWLEPGQTFHAKNRFRSFTERYIDNPSMADLAKYALKAPNER